MELLNYNVLPLKDMAIRRVVNVLFKEPDILASIRNFHYKALSYLNDSIKVWRETVEDKMSDKISKIGLPNSLTKLLIDTVKPMSRQMPGWKAIHEEYLQILRPVGEPVLERLSWTVARALDYRKTAEELIRSNVIDVASRYQLACLYCLEDYISQLWNELPEENKMYFYNEEQLAQIGKLRLQFCWPFIIREEQSKLDCATRSCTRDSIRFNLFAFQESARMPNKAAAEYFFQKLTRQEKDVSLITTTKALLSSRHSYHGRFPKENVSEMLRYLLSVMTPDQQMRIFQEESYLVLKCFVDWPLQDLFSEVADAIWHFVPESGYSSLLWDMYLSFANSGHYFLVLFQELYLRIPYDLRESFVLESDLLHEVLHNEDKESLETIFRSVDTEARKALVFSKTFFKHSHSSMSRDRWDVLDVCVREANLSKEDRERLKATFMGYLTSSEGEKTGLETLTCTRFSQFLDEAYASGKRCSEDETPTEAKMKKNGAVRSESK